MSKEKTVTNDLRCNNCGCELTYEDWQEHGCPNCEKGEQRKETDDNQK